MLVVFYLSSHVLLQYILGNSFYTVRCSNKTVYLLLFYAYVIIQ